MEPVPLGRSQEGRRWLDLVGRRRRSGGFINAARIQIAVGTRLAGERANMPFSIHPHMLRHSCGYKFANEGRDTRSLQAYLGHRNIQSTVRYTAMAPDRFKGWEQD